jgi:hypothetical protein
VADHQYAGSRNDGNFVETGSSYYSVRPAASTVIPKSSILIPVSTDEIVQTLNLLQCCPMDQAVISRHVNVEIGFQFPAISCGIFGG